MAHGEAQQVFLSLLPTRKGLAALVHRHHLLQGAGKPKPSLIPSCRHHLVTVLSVPGRAPSWEGQRPKSCFWVATAMLPLPRDEQSWPVEEAETHSNNTVPHVSRAACLAHPLG